MDVVLTYRYYYSARETVDLGQGTNNTAIRCIRDAYNDPPANP